MIEEFPITSQRDPAEFVGLAIPLPAIVSWQDFHSARPTKPPVLIDGILHQGCKLILGGTSKSNKSWCLMNLAVSLANGAEWMGRKCQKTKVLLINFELHEWAAHDRLFSIQEMHNPLAQHKFEDSNKNLFVWNLRGRNADLSAMRPALLEHIGRGEYGAIIVDPAYKVLGSRDENANGEIADLMNEFEKIACETGSAIIMAHHFAKGDSSSKNAIDRMSGAGAWARDPDAILVMSPHEEPDCFTVSPILRNMPPMDEFVIRWQFPHMLVDKALNPAELKRPQSTNKKASDTEIMQCIGVDRDDEDLTTVLGRIEQKYGMKESQARDRINRLIAQKLVGKVAKKVYLIKQY